MINPRTIAQEIAYADVATRCGKFAGEADRADAESSGPDSLSSALSDFQSAVDALNSDTDGPVTLPPPAIMTRRPFPPIPVRRREATRFSLSNWRRGSKPRSVWATTPFSATGTFELTMGDSTMDIDLSAADQNGDGDGFIDASELVNAINDSDDNPCVSAALVKPTAPPPLCSPPIAPGRRARFR